jgi:transcriptional regulator with XRE-family HTH domain
MTAMEQAIEGIDREHLGARLRQLRLDAGLSLRELAARLEISVSAISQIERGVLQPSVNRLIAIVTALGVPLARVFDDAEDEAVTPAPHRYELARSGSIRPVSLESGVLYRRLSPVQTAGVDFFESTYPPGSQADAGNHLITHVGYEIGTVQLGELTIQFEDETVHLRAGDSITYPCEIPHHIMNRGAVPAVATWLIVHGRR